jgi:predicted Rossmann fold flavoprotein
VIADLLIREMNRLQVGVFSGTRVTGIEKDPSGAFRITVESVGGSDPGKEKNNRNRRKKEDPRKSGWNRYDRNGKLKTESGREVPERRICLADRVILCTGGLAGPAFGCSGDGYALAESLGHSRIPTVPALTPLLCPEKALKLAAGVRCPAAITLVCDGEAAGSEQGELQIVETAVSGIPVFQLSRLAGYALRDGREVRIRADFLPGMPEEEWQKQADLRLRDGRNQTLEQLFMGLVHPKLLRFILNRLGLVSEQKRAGVKTEQIRQVLELMRGLDFEITGLTGYEKAQVTAGGIPLTETDPDTMESLVCPGLYLAGELLDADGICGGYNLQWAMTGGLLAGRAAADKMNHEV